MFMEMCSNSGIGKCLYKGSTVLFIAQYVEARVIVFLLQEAASISSLKPALEAKGVPLYGIVHEEVGVEEFREYFKGPLFLDNKVSYTYTRHTQNINAPSYFYSLRMCMCFRDILHRLTIFAEGVLWIKNGNSW